MPTIEEAERKQSEWIMIGKLVNKYLFIKRDKEKNRTITLLTLVFIDETGDVIEIKTWSRLKAFYVYRKLKRNQCYSIRGEGAIARPDPEFSTSRYEFTSPYWWIEPSDDFRLKKYMSCSTNLSKSINAIEQESCVNILGLYVDKYVGPGKHYINGKPAVQGYYVKLQDDSNNLFYVLVWHLTRIDKSKWALFDCEPGDTVLINSVRSSSLATCFPKHQQHYTVTSIYSPVVDSECVSSRRIQDLKRKFNAPE